MTDAEWAVEVGRVEDAVCDLLDAIAEDRHEYVRAQDVHGNQRTGIMIDGRVMFIVLPTEQQTPLHTGTETLN